MRLLCVICTACAFILPSALSFGSIDGIEALIRRRLPSHQDDFVFELTNTSSTNNASIITTPNDEFTVSDGPNGTIKVCGNSQIALTSGLRWYLTNVAHVDIYWFIGSRLHLAPTPLPRLNGTYSGKSIVPWRYDFNTVTFSYTSPFWAWEDWELQLDWMSLRGINLALAWVGYEKILVEVFREAGFSDADISTFVSGPAFQAWNRFGNIQGSWGGELPMSWIDSQFELNKQIVARMVELGITPVLPCLTGFVPMQIANLYPNASVVNGSQWNEFPRKYTNDSFLEPFDPLFLQMQKSFISKQTEAYGEVTHIYTLDQYNENDPFSGDLTYLRNVTSNTYASLQAADPDAIWMLQGWLFYSSEDFWTDARTEAYLSGVDNEHMLILDLFSESEPQWQRTNNYYGKPWIWCMLHDYGGNMGLYGQVENITINPIEALANRSSTMIGMGLTMEGQEGNEIMYDLVLDQAWAAQPVDTEVYFHDWVTSRYAPQQAVPQQLYIAWDVMRSTVYNNTDLELATAVTKSILELAPNTTGLVNRTGHHPTTITYNNSALLMAWSELYDAAQQAPSLWDNPAYIFDLTDVTRQVLANAFVPIYESFVAAANSTLIDTCDSSTAAQSGNDMITLLLDLDAVLTAADNPGFSLPIWISSARALASNTSASLNSNMSRSMLADFYEYNARNQITLWGPNGEIDDYASKQWGGLVRSYYVPRWKMFVDYTLNSTTSSNGENEGLSQALLDFGKHWDLQQWGESAGEAFTPSEGLSFQSVLADVVERWPSVFG